ncbi:hypothetical protein [Salisediminibacterium halotolerans]|uniref:hypothetical protein n=1 Tax=Salisediminibacterium halotolerans TaxID=517425 RepID=UPI000EAB7E13|nr:hypothetical protein [Salisediminibacterium halotolerans]RLJ78081.1 hypothetical protein BCL39_0547 [Actinophytocola xinjiangensis]RPE88581.1 hypothetical protein EDD67_0912 [Salisediminibacterium halotolerans]TWG37058.1 hypothetical protein BCL52_0546 [Salisediminibacterium halotolerans]GEL06912.1 hypothetical protein SHA02_03280 [Salisediminibacterium halotolerans]
MEKTQITVTDEITANYQKFSEYVVCVEVMKNGESMGSFCSDAQTFDEWDEEEIIDMIKLHVTQMQKGSTINEQETLTLKNGWKIKYHQHWDDFYCVDIFDGLKDVGSFCADRGSFEEWMEDEDQLLRVIQDQLNLSS